MKQVRDGLQAEFDYRSASIRLETAADVPEACEFCCEMSNDGLLLSRIHLSQPDLQALVDLAREAGMVIR